MGGVQYDYAAYDYSGTKAMDVEAAIESLNGKGQIYIDKVDPVSYTHLDVYKRQM